MIAYNKTWLNNLCIRHDLRAKADDGLITEEELANILPMYPDSFISHGIVGRIGFGFLTFIALSFGAVLISLFVLGIFKSDNIFLPSLVFGICCYLILENFVKKENYYKGGIDDMLLYATVGFIVIFISLSFDNVGSGSHQGIRSLAICCLCLFLTLRFADMLTSFLTCTAFLSFVFFAWQNLGAFGAETLPFVMMIASAAIYIAVLKLIKHPNALYYPNCIIVAKITSLIALYLSGNYFIVQKLGSQLNHLPAGAKIPFGFIFWVWTIALPFAYLAAGVKRKDMVLIRVAMLLCIGTVLTFRYYYHFLSAEVAFIIGGATLLAIAYAAIRWLKHPKHGITYKDTGTKNLADRLNIESLVVSQTLGHTSPAPQQDKPLFGGGSFGGGGSSSNY